MALKSPAYGRRSLEGGSVVSCVQREHLADSMGEARTIPRDPHLWDRYLVSLLSTPAPPRPMDVWVDKDADSSHTPLA